MIANGISVRKMILKRTDIHGMSVVYIEQLRYDKDLKPKTKKISTGIKVKPSQWSKIKQEVLKSDPDYVTKNQTINEAYIANLKPAEEVATVKGITEYLDDYIAYRKANGTPYTTYKEYTTLKGRIKAYENYVGTKLFFDDMNLTFSGNLNIWAVNEKKYGAGTIDKTFILLRTFIKHFYKRRDELGISMTDIWKDEEFKFGTPSQNAPHPVIAEDFQKLMNANLDNEALQKTLDRFLFQCCTSIRFGDAFRLTPANVVNDCIKYEPSKTRNKKNNIVYVNLNYTSRRILAKYDDDMSKLKITNQKYNESLKALCTELELSDKYRSHDGRDTFIQNAINEGISIPIILSWTGQESYEVMKRYFTVDERQKRGAMHKLVVFDDPEKAKPFPPDFDWSTNNFEDMIPAT